MVVYPIFSLFVDGADPCLGGIDHKRQLGIGTWKGQRCRLGKTGFQSLQGRQSFAWHFYWALLFVNQRVEGRCDLCTVRDEAAVEVGHTKESPELAFGSRVWVFGNCFDFGLEVSYTLVIYHVIMLSHSSTCPSSPPVRNRLAAGKPRPGVAGALLHSYWR